MSDSLVFVLSRYYDHFVEKCIQRAQANGWEPPLLGITLDKMSCSWQFGSLRFCFEACLTVHGRSQTLGTCCEHSATSAHMDWSCLGSLVLSCMMETSFLLCCLTELGSAYARLCVWPRCIFPACVFTYYTRPACRLLKCSLTTTRRSDCCMSCLSL